MPDTNIVNFFNKNIEEHNQQRTSLKVELHGCKIELDVYGNDYKGVQDVLEKCLKTASLTFNSSAK
ncbi:MULTISPECIES: hypothetical protein [Acinetobacter]|uniref:Uncharacterized protein n=1 Tax=Acinetobacter corruptisaponis TaxID=3045147 RepID=A0ABY8S5M3_9GAMM|nr:hypothetical protein [Acinetobacter sp. KCTC 92772]WHP07007.1 hypothetical protein QLH32_05970 [Acinetobacter sp. KCTC 92772]